MEHAGPGRITPGSLPRERMAIVAKEGAKASTVIGPSITVTGSLQGDEDLVVQGRVEGSISLTRTLMLEPSGIVKAEVRVKHAIIAGVVVGNIQATDSVELTAECRMVGDISAPRVIIVEGASFRGRVDMGDLDIPRLERDRTARPAKAPAASRLPPPRTVPAVPVAAARAAKAAPPPAPPSAAVLGNRRKVVVKKK